MSHKYESLEEILTNLKLNKIKEYNEVPFTGNFVEKNFLFRSKIRKLCQEPYCPGSPIQSQWDVGKCRNECPIVNNM